MYSSDRMRRNEILLISSVIMLNALPNRYWTTFETLAQIERDCKERQLNSAWEIDTTPGQADDIGKYWYRLQNGSKQFKYSLMFQKG